MSGPYVLKLIKTQVSSEIVAYAQWSIAAKVISMLVSIDIEAGKVPDQRRVSVNNSNEISIYSSEELIRKIYSNPP